jgi:hypothetical protein
VLLKKLLQILKNIGVKMLKQIKCKICNKNMQWQLNKEEALVHCHDCRRAVVVSDWHSNAELFGK